MSMVRLCQGMAANGKDLVRFRDTIIHIHKVYLNDTRDEIIPSLV